MQICRRGACLNSNSTGGIKRSVGLPAGSGARGARSSMGERVRDGMHVSSAM